MVTEKLYEVSRQIIFEESTLIHAATKAKALHIAKDNTNLNWDCTNIPTPRKYVATRLVK